MSSLIRYAQILRSKTLPVDENPAQLGRVTQVLGLALLRGRLCPLLQIMQIFAGFMRSGCRKEDGALVLF